MNKKNILLKLTGEIITHSDKGLDASFVRSIARQINELKSTCNFSIVIGGGNFFRGSIEGEQIRLSTQVGHYVGMLATVMNGLIIQDIFEQNNIKTELLTAITCPQIAQDISSYKIINALNEGKCIIFTGGTGNPFFTTDTNAVLRALQINAFELWKGTKVDGVFAQDPVKNPQSPLLKETTYEQALQNKLGIMDLEAFVMAQKNNLVIRIFNIFQDNALIKAFNNKDFGSIIK